MQRIRIYAAVSVAKSRAGLRLMLLLFSVAWFWIGLIPAPLQGQTVGPDPRPTDAPHPGNQPDRAAVSPHLAAELAAAQEPVSFLVMLKEQPDYGELSVAARAAAGAATTEQGPAQPEARGRYLYETLTRDAAASQAGLRAWLDARDVPYRAFYLINMLRVEGDAALVEALRERPEVARLAANPVVAAAHVPDRWAAPRLAAPAGTEQQDAPARGEVDARTTASYGLVVTHAAEMWAMGYEGQGVVVAGQDTGVQWDHPAMRSSYRGWDGQQAQHPYNWLDAWAGDDSTTTCAGQVAPCDDNGHGTHTLGSVVGSTAGTIYGVAPEAQWMGCRNMLQGFGAPDTYTACFEFFLAPYPPGGDPFTDGRPDLAPHVINNSWGCPPREGCEPDTLRMVVEAMEAAGQLVVASAGNTGPGCSSLDDPIGIYEPVLSVGAHSSQGSLASFSSRGPVEIDGSGRLKPDITAPGVGIYAPYRFSSYTTLSGTSMAAPHVTGAAAVLWSAAPYLMGEPVLTKQLLLKSAGPVRTNLCTEQAEAVSPNPGFGYGRLNVAEAVRLARTPWVLNVEVMNAAGEPVADAEVTWRDGRTGQTRSGTTSAMGRMELDLVFAGDHTLHVSAEPTGEMASEMASKVVVPDAPADSIQGEAAGDGLTLRYTLQNDSRLPGFHRYFLPTMHLSPED